MKLGLFGRACAAASLALASVVAAPSAADAKPLIDKIHFLIPGGPGGGWDGTARGIGEALTKAGIVGSATYENMSGGGGGKAIAHLIETATTQHGTLMVNSTPIVIRSLQKVFPQNFRDLELVAATIGDYGAIVASTKSDIKTFADLVKAYKANPRKVAIGGGSVAGGMDHLVAALVMKAVGADPTKVKYIPYDAGGKAMAGLLSGEIKALATGFSEAVALAEQGQVRILCVTAEKRVADKPDYPTCKEVGADAVFVNWRGFFAAPGLPADKKASYIEALTKMYETKEWEAVRSRNGWVKIFKPGKEFKTFLEQQEKQIGELMKELGFL
ncbi:MAG: tripartite tricarboxylate transporter substrate binding protein [Neomegalonema sp.]|nr:tripartite tricarboxylate transporter substrate binding protein [Neomegalonema sp.]